jgi:hypothetical protein
MRRLAVTLCLSLLVAGCSGSGSAKADLQTKMNAVTQAANAKDAAALRSAASDFLTEVQQQSANADITTTKAQDLKTVATRLLAEAATLEQASPSPRPTASPSPSPTPSPSPSPEPSPSPSPEPSQPPSVVPSVEVSASPAGGLLSPAASTQS